MGTPPVPVVHHPACRLHDPGAGHPERPERIDAVLGALRTPDLGGQVAWHEARPATREQLERVHAAPYLNGLEQVAHAGGGALDADTVMSPTSWEAALAAAGVALGAVECGLASGRAFGATRPPGHHALAARAMGFCLINNVVVAGGRRSAQDRLAALDAARAGWRPDLLLVSAGFDSLAGDPLGGFTLEPDDIATWTRALRERVAPSPVVGLLEGGYRLDLLAAGVRAHVQALA